MRLGRLSQLLIAVGTTSVVTATAFSYVTPAADAAAARAPAPDVRATAIDVIARMHLLPTRDGDPDDPSRYCDPSQMLVMWAQPLGTYKHGSYIEPLGPPPRATTTAVNGVVVCEGSLYAYAGFEAIRVSAGWNVVPVPEIDDDETDRTAPEPAGDTVDPGLIPHAHPPLPAAKPAPSDVVPDPANVLPAGIEPYAPYDAQRSCSPSAKPGVLAFRTMILKSNPDTRSLGITRTCSAGGTSEHKEGRAWDWGARADQPAERAEAERMLDWLLATDEHGNTHAMARRLGIMYIVWNRHIWGAYRASEGWRSYHGANPHTDHVHFSFAWPGARAQTSFWTGTPVDMPGSFSPARGAGTREGGSRNRRASHGKHRGDVRRIAAGKPATPKHPRDEWRKHPTEPRPKPSVGDWGQHWWRTKPRPSARPDPGQEQEVEPSIAPSVAPAPTPETGNDGRAGHRRWRHRDGQPRNNDDGRDRWQRARGEAKRLRRTPASARPDRR